jgi:hypothetical protein
MCFGILPFADVAVVLYAFPYSVPLLKPLVPLSIIDFAICPGVDAFSMCLAVFELAKIGIVVRISLKAFAIAHVVLPEAFILPAIWILHDAFAVSHAVAGVPEVDGALVALFNVALNLTYGLQVNLF